jgi:hypothetical protein
MALIAATCCSATDLNGKQALKEFAVVHQSQA